MAKITVFGTLRKNDSNKFSKIALKVSPNIDLQDRIVIFPEKMSGHFQGAGSDSLLTHRLPGSRGYPAIRAR